MIVSQSPAALAVAFSIRCPGSRIQPLDSPSSWKRYLMGFPFLYPSLGIGILGMPDGGSLDLPVWARMGFGIPQLPAGVWLFLRAGAVLGFGPMFGSEGASAVTEPYRISRNPQSVGSLLMLAGWSLLSASSAAAVVSLFGFPPLLSVPFAEEPWLRERYGRMYEEFARRVGRFI